ncbi:T. brucei spp.-specific protein [Trypanosoma brucei gambiense DAL972]|uniref:T. brucei spp.-specific protein n=1 Tax=Trypanosoma brucei gambiense (strain MHOM/CI/86/DAL972) TaxID=679716 RepID=C9ZIY2_TRYB9|nr:T. brucei spp.-specific protein [Trypanosoma brucei gambiense DAL972]CBH09310.1 T. brucei spp.-specific protein [Trypanosoma brucei gambiense DAL972]|eukprot:XP_011771618.1 T. brucei spp.-specific protein [Trypanosoma brucei gambiense DAL972]
MNSHWRSPYDGNRWLNEMAQCSRLFFRTHPNKVVKTIFMICSPGRVVLVILSCISSCRPIPSFNTTLATCSHQNSWKHALKKKYKGTCSVHEATMPHFPSAKVK